MLFKNTPTTSTKIKVLIVDDSLVFRKFLEELLGDSEEIVIVGEAKNGIEALDMVLRTVPNVILLDLEMPLMDGMTALQHLMIHRPTPTIMFSSLTEQGTARSFDTLKNGAVDFFCKDFIFQKNSLQTYRTLLIDKVKKAAAITIAAREPAFFVEKSTEPMADQQIIFCEECGSRVTISRHMSEQLQNIACSTCGDTIDLHLSTYAYHRRTTFITVFGGGEGSFFNLLEIIPHLEPDMGGALMAVIHQSADHVNGFAEYLDAISAVRVVRAQEGSNIEGGNCYIISGREYMSVKPHNGLITIEKLQKKGLKGGAFDTLLASVGTLFARRAAGVVLSGDDVDGDVGISILMRNNGRGLVLAPRECYCKTMSRHVMENCGITETFTTRQMIRQITEMHYRAKHLVKADRYAAGNS